MKFIKYYFILPFCLIIFSGFIYPDDDQMKKDILLHLVMQNVDRKHYNPTTIDDDFSKKVFDKYLQIIDKGKRLLLVSDVKTLSRFETQLDDEIQKKERAFFELSFLILQKRIDAVRDIIETNMETPFDFEKEEFIELSSKKRAYAKNEKEWRDNWRKYLKYRTLQQLHKLLQDQEGAIEADNKTITPKSMEELEVDARSKILKQQRKWHDNLKKKSSLKWFHNYLQSITKVFDPHTVFMPPKSRQKFETSLRGSLEGIGAMLREKNGKLTIVSLTPGGPAAKQGQLKSEDAILKVAEKGAEKVDIVGMEINDAIKLIKGPKGTEVVLTVQRPNGELVDITIVRDTVVLDKGSIKSAILKSEDYTEPVAYLKLEKFYVDFKNKNGRSCAKDMKAELARLKAQNINKLIIDLRSNGGGSLQQVVEMAGLFIESGPIVQIKSTSGRIGLHNDKDPNIHYSGDVVVLVNGGSASASEIFAAAIQDYHRGLIVGSRATFGKGSAQVMYPLEPYLPTEQKHLKPLGSIKTTIQKFYRVNGGTTQTQGLTPDIVLPDAYSYIEAYGERRKDHVLLVDEIPSAKFETWHHSAQNVEQLYAECQKRLNASEHFAQIDAYHQYSQKHKQNTYRSLSLKAYRTEQAIHKIKADEYRNHPPIEGFNIENFEMDKAEIESDSLLQKKTVKFHEQLQKDFYLHETFHIIHHLQTDTGVMSEEE